MSAIKNFYFEQICNAVDDDYDYQYQKWLESGKNDSENVPAHAISEDAGSKK